MAGRPDPKRPRRIVDPEAGKAKVEAEGRCRVCERRARPWWQGGSYLTGLTRSHLVPKGQGGDDVDANIVPLCGMGPGTCHARAEANDPEVRAAIRAVLAEEEIEYVIGREGRAWLERRYPKGGRR